MMRILLALLILLTVFPAQAWWNDTWTVRKAITLNTASDGADLKEGLADVPVLVRLHTGNFDFISAREDGADLRFIAEDDMTPLKFHVEKYDSLNEVALVWVQVPKLQPGNNTQKIWLYAGNDEAVVASDEPGSYDVRQTGVWHFGEVGGAPRDATGYANHAAEFTGARVAGAVIGGGVAFDGQNTLEIPATPSLNTTAAGGFTFSVWLKPASADQNAVLFSRQDAGKRFTVGLEMGKLYAAVADGALETRSTLAELNAGAWNHVAVVAAQNLLLYVNGYPAGEAAVASPDLAGAISIGQGYVGELDELNLANVPRAADWIKALAVGQGGEAKLTVIGEDELGEGGGEASYFGVILKNVTLDGWVVIVILMVMLGISAMVMVTKAMVIGKTAKANRQFMEAFHSLKTGETAALDADDNPEDADLKDAGLASVMFGHHDHFQNSSLYRIYHAGIQEVKKRVGERSNVELSPQALDSIRATLDGTLVRENQKLNNLMVLLTIAISGGPFLGLLGTVIGVMITFAAIAATGDVNVAAIAPGIAAALVATAAGVGVAIPSLFGYNYLGSRIKSIGADMHVFVDEYIAKIAETYSRDA
jgi:biopolymer transport protein ExbB